MKRSGFTMIELVFIIVILGILAAIAVPKMAASRDDAVAVAIKSDIGTMTQAIPAMYMSQGSLTSIGQAVNLDTSRWSGATGLTVTSVLASATSGGTACATVEYTTAIAADATADSTITAGDTIVRVTVIPTGSCSVLRGMFGGTASENFVQRINLASSGIKFN
ncbi:MAG: prepilin-type N-terminal cleavage/methylation domain-containing protein [Wolinella succinogenes]|uniref:type II secretion system protein n=1 Tax=Wolinella succinogenes TaxID=844 RepID=UPI00169DDA04|nr:prepilin-type N-terminal cleavage/methylation domain-containing protein [Wolinella succinogenes]NLU34032.1 prepilin-type N-terminal cleavage/methylation domain-containing protein [Wolinella succinogenes]